MFSERDGKEECTLSNSNDELNLFNLLHSFQKIIKRNIFSPICTHVLFKDNIPYTKPSLLTFRNNAKFLWKRIPQPIKTANPELGLIWAVGQCMWQRNFPATYASLNKEWSETAKPIMEAISGKRSLDY